MHVSFQLPTLELFSNRAFLVVWSMRLPRQIIWHHEGSLLGDQKATIRKQTEIRTEFEMSFQTSDGHDNETTQNPGLGITRENN